MARNINMAKRSKKNEKPQAMAVCDGIYIGSEFFEEKENRILTLFLKGFTVYLLTMGSIGFYLSAIGIGYNAVLAHIIIFIMAMMCAMLYYRLLVENIGYLILFLGFSGLVILFRTYVNSGFYAVVNVTVNLASQYFDVDIQRLYTEQIENRYVTVTIFVIFIGFVMDVFLNVYISRRMQYVTVYFVVMFLNVIPLYLVYEPDALYAIMLLAGMAMAYVFKSGKHYSPQVSVKRSSAKYIIKKTGRKKHKKENVDYVYDVKSMLQAGILAFVFAAIVLICTRSVRPVESFNVGYQGNKYKEITMSGFTTLLTEGFSGFNRYSQDTGGLDSGKLGEVSSIRLDGQTDLILQFTPYSAGTVYLRSFVGERYKPYQNSWTSISDENVYSEEFPEADAYKDYYEDGGENSAKAVMRQRTIDAYGKAYLMPYYGDKVLNEKNGYYSITYYPYLDGNEAYVDSSYYDYAPVLASDLYVPEENIEAVNEFIDELDWIGSDEDNIQAVIDYFQENIPYTIKPGKTPKNKDFVNYFLQEGRKGYCSYFASAATLIFRAMGIPARYVEGYAVSLSQVMDGELLDGMSYEDYYDGYSALGETAMVEVEVTDADAHAWVEVYEQGRGWYVVDVTPSSDEEDEDSEDFWDVFDRLMNADGTSDGDGTDDLSAGDFHLSDALLKNVGVAILGLLLLVLVGFMAFKGYRVILVNIRYAKSDRNDKLVIRYSEFCRRLSKREKTFANCHNYSDQLGFISDKNAAAGINIAETVPLDELEDILERAGFSGREISEEELDKALEWLKKLSVPKQR
jgi:transglutaminase-like putative cysteine protease